MASTAEDALGRAGLPSGAALAAVLALGAGLGLSAESLVLAVPREEASGELAEEGPPESPPEASPESRSEPPPRFEEAVTVVATRTEQRLAETAASVTVLDREDLDVSAALAVDDALRQVPGFTLFRRTGSRTANPTAQGASLRGIGGSAASRALVLADGIPFSDPFGGWIPWGRVPRAALGRVEVLRGGGSDLYGSSALTGVVHLLRLEVTRPEVRGEVFAGTQGTGGASVWLAAGSGPWHAALAADLFETEGYVPIAPAHRGAVDTPAGTSHGALEVTLGRRTASGRGFLRASAFEEERANGTRLQDNDTSLRELALGADWQRGPSAFMARAWGSDQRFRQSFTAVAADRSSESLARRQEIPADALGGSATWVRGFEEGEESRAQTGNRAHTFVTGLELRRTRGVSEETIFLPGLELEHLAGGEQEIVGAYVEDLARLGPGLTVTAGLRYDWWRNARGRIGPLAAPEEPPGRRESALSPRLALRWQAAPEWALSASAYRSFRAPTLNELFRGFRVGNIVTDPNPELAAERLQGAEVGATWSSTGGGSGWRARGTLFWMELEDGITNLTVEVSPELIRRRRANLGRSRSRGVELEGAAELGARWRLSAAYLFTDAEVVRFSADPSLEGLRVPQVPEHKGSFQVRGLSGRGAWAALQMRWFGAQHDDDRNLFVLDQAVLVDLQVARPLGRRLELFVAAENLLDREYLAGRTPRPTLGSPRLLRLGLRWAGAGSGGP